MWRETMRYGIGKHANQAQDTGRGDLIFQAKFPLGTDPDAMDRWFEEEAIRRGLIKGERRQLPQEQQQKDRGKIFNDALLRAVGHKDAKRKPVPLEVLDALTDDEGNPLEVVEQELPKIYPASRLPTGPSTSRHPARSSLIPADGRSGCRRRICGTASAGTACDIGSGDHQG